MAVEQRRTEAKARASRPGCEGAVGQLIRARREANSRSGTYFSSSNISPILYSIVSDVVRGPRCAGRANQTADARALMGAEIVEDDDVAFLECEDENLLDIGDETLVIDGVVDSEWRIDPIAPQRRDEGQRLQRPWGAFAASRRPLRPQTPAAATFSSSPRSRR